MRENLTLVLYLALLSTATTPLIAQVQLKLQLQPDGKTYTLSARPQADFLPPLANLLTQAQITLVVPANSFEPENLQNYAGQWFLSTTIAHPPGNAGADYAVFKLANTTADLVFEQGQEVPLFSFENKKGCTGAFELLDHFTDPLFLQNPQNLPIGNTFYLEGAGGDAYTGNYGQGAANCFAMSNCLIMYELESSPNGFYKISLKTDPLWPTDTLASLRVALKVPTGYFEVYQLASLHSGLLVANISRYNSPVEVPGYDYLQIRMTASGQGLVPQPGVSLPLLKFANGGSCQGDSIFLVENADDAFMPPNSQAAPIGQQVRLKNGSAINTCPGSNAAAPCTGCLFTVNTLQIDSVQTAGPVACLGMSNGMIRFFATGADDLSYSLDGGQTWSDNAYFSGLGAQNYQPVVRGLHLGCPVERQGTDILLEEDNSFSLQIDVPAIACKGSDVGLKVLSPNPLPASTVYQWTGPNGFSAAIPDPSIFNTNLFQSGNYALTVAAPGCALATAVAHLQIVEPPIGPTLLANAAICQGEEIQLSTDIAAAKYEWIGPAGQSASTLALPGLTTSTQATQIPVPHPAYLPGNWKVRITDGNGCTAESEPVLLNIKTRPQAFASNNGPVCYGSNAELSGNPLPGAVYYWKKQGETAIFSLQQNPVLSNISSEQSFVLQVELNGCLSENTAMTTVALHPKPSAFPEFDYQMAADCAPADLNFQSNATGAGLSFLWTGANGFVSQLPNPSIPAASADANGSYLLEVTNFFGCKTANPFQVTGVVDAPPTPIIQSSGSACPGGNVQLSVEAYNSPSVSYQWFKNNSPIFGATSNTLNLNGIQAAQEGNYKLRASIGACVLTSAESIVDVLAAPSPEPSFFLTQNCEGGSLQFFSNTNGIAAWHWTGPNGFSSESPTPLIYNTEFNDIGAYSLTVVGVNGCSASEGFVVDGILPVPPTPQVATNSPVCPEDSILLTVQNPVLSGNVYYEWQNGNGTYIGSGEAMLSIATDDPLAVPPFLVKTVHNTCPSALSDPVPVEVKPLPVASAANSGAACPGSAVQLFAAPVPNGVYEWREAGSTQAISFEQNPTLLLQDSTTFELVVKSGGCETAVTATTTVPVYPLPAIEGLSGGGSYCEGAAVQLSAVNNVPLSGTVQYTWSGPNGFSFTGTAGPAGPFPLHIAVLQSQNEGAYTLSLQSQQGCASASQSVAVDYVEMPLPPQLTVSDNQLCQGEVLQLDASSYTGNSVEYQWYFTDGVGQQLLGTTALPTFFQNNITAAQGGIYFVKTNVDGCTPLPSNMVAVSVSSLPASLPTGNTTAAAFPACEGGEVQLFTEFIPGASYSWSGPAGFQSFVHNPLVEDVQAHSAGDYYVVVGIPGCTAQLSAGTSVYVSPLPETPVLAGELEICEGSEAIFTISNPVAGAVYDLFFAENNDLVASGTAPVFTMDSISAAQGGAYFVLAKKDGCSSAPSAALELSVVEQLADLALAGDDVALCDGEKQALLQASAPVAGTGQWFSLDGAGVVHPNLASTPAINLQAGANRFVWQVGNPVCQQFSRDTVIVFVEKMELQNDQLYLLFNDSLAGANLLENDDWQSPSGPEFFIIKKPKKGTLSDDGTGIIGYRPYPNAFGEDSFSYAACSMHCPEVCDTAWVKIFIEGSNGSPSDCFVPNLITPDGDGQDDEFIIPCAMSYPGSSLLVFNRYGGKIFETGDYQNDWSGTYDGQPLPVGTYFYQMVLQDGEGTVLKGYVAVVR
jgi:gliding motility-associated-like protein